MCGGGNEVGGRGGAGKQGRVDGGGGIRPGRDVWMGGGGTRWGSKGGQLGQRGCQGLGQARRPSGERGGKGGQAGCLRGIEKCR